MAPRLHNSDKIKKKKTKVRSGNNKVGKKYNNKRLNAVKSKLKQNGSHVVKLNNSKNEYNSSCKLKTLPVLKTQNRKVRSRPVLSEEEKMEIDSRTIFVGNLPKSIDRKELKRLFTKYGPIESVRLRCSSLNVSFTPRSIAVDKKDFHPSATSVIGYVKFVSKDTVEEALAANGTNYEENCLRVDRLNFKPETSQNSVFLGNLPFVVTDDDVRKIFSDCGEITSVRIVRDNATGIGKGYGYINFKRFESIELALKLDGILINKRGVRVRRAVKRLSEKSKLEALENIKNEDTNKNAISSNETTKSSRVRRLKKKKNKDKVTLAFQGRTTSDKIMKKRKSKKKLKNERTKKGIIEILNKRNEKPQLGKL